MEVNYCRSGRIGWKIKNGNQIYLGPGKFSLNTLDICTDSTICLPTEHYEGLSLSIDFNELAAKLLRETNLNMAQISEQIGYESQSKFTAAFKAYYQMLPKEYRKNDDNKF